MCIPGDLYPSCSLERRGKDTVRVCWLLGSTGKSLLREIGFCAAPQPITNVSRNASCVSFPGSAGRGEQGGRGGPPASPNKLCQESGALPLGGNKSQRSRLFPHHRFPWKGKPAGGSLRPGRGSSRCVTPAPKETGGEGPRAGTPPGPPTFPGAQGAAAGPEGRASPAFAGAWGPRSPGPAPEMRGGGRVPTAAWGGGLGPPSRGVGPAPAPPPGKPQKGGPVTGPV